MSNPPPLPNRTKITPREFAVLSLNDISRIVEERCGNVFVLERHGEGSNHVIILPEAFQEFKSIVSYHRVSPMNRCEQKYIGLGHFFADKEGNISVVVSHFIQFHTMNRTTISASSLGPNGERNPGVDFLEYYRNEYIQSENVYNTDAFGFSVDPFVDKYGHSEFVLDGHTHPNLGTFFSNTDIQSGTAHAGQLPVCIFVCDPIRGEMLGRIGKDFSDAQVIVYDRELCVDLLNPVCFASLERRTLFNYIMALIHTYLNRPNTKGKAKFRIVGNGKERAFIKLRH